jgi:hypothetical protein
LENIADLMFEVLKLFNSSHEFNDKMYLLGEIALEYYKAGKAELALQYIRNINEKYIKCRAYLKLANLAESQGKMLDSVATITEALDYIKGENDDYLNTVIKSMVSVELAKNGKFDEAMFVMKEALNSALSIDISIQPEVVFELAILSSELAMNGRKKEANAVMRKALASANSLYDENDKTSTLIFISKELVRQGKAKMASKLMNKILAYAQEIEDPYCKSSCLYFISCGYHEQGETETAIEVMNETLECIRVLGNREKIRALVAFSSTLSVHGKKDEAALLIGEAIECVNSNNADGLLSNEINESIHLLSLELYSQREFNLLEKTAMIISEKSLRITFWKEIGRNELNLNGYYSALVTISQFNSTEAKYYFKLGILENINPFYGSDKIYLNIFKDITIQFRTIEHALKMYVLNQILFGKINDRRARQFNRALNIQWAIDIKDQLN